jgi:uncharacterized protein YprB with RNaseH-like and TPR domain
MYLLSPNKCRRVFYFQTLDDWIEVYLANQVEPEYVFPHHNHLANFVTQKVTSQSDQTFTINFHTLDISVEDWTTSHAFLDCHLHYSQYFTRLDGLLHVSLFTLLFPSQAHLLSPSTQWVVCIPFEYDKTYLGLQSYFATQIVLGLHNNLNATQVQSISLEFDGLNEPTFRVIIYDTKMIKTIIQATQDWNELLYSDIAASWSLEDEECPHPYMMPNLCSGNYLKLKEELAWRWKDLSLLYFVGNKTRQQMFLQSIFTLDDPRCLTYLHRNSQSSSSLVYQTQQLMLQHMFQPVQLRLVQSKATTRYQQYVYLDIENTVDSNNKPIVNLVGIFYLLEGKFQYKSFTSKNQDCLTESSLFLQQHLPNHTIVHYTAADCVAIPPSHQRLDLFDVIKAQYLQDTELQSLHLHNFKLKTIYKQLCCKYKFRNLYHSLQVSNGLQALLYLQRWIEDDDEQPLEDVVRYNEVDCIALACLHMCLQQEWDQKLMLLIDE